MTSPHLAVANATPAAPARARPTAQRLALGAVAGPALFTLAWLVLGFLSPGYTLFGTLITPYSPISQPISGLGLGPTGAFMNTAFVLSGLLLLAGVAGIFQTVRPSGRRPAGRVSAALLALSPLGLVVAGSFTLEAVMPHLLGFLLASGTPVASFLTTGQFLRGIPGWRRFGTWLLLGSPLTLVLLVGFFLTFDPAAAGANVGMAGLVQRVLAIEVHAWFVAMGWLAYRRSNSLLSCPGEDSRGVQRSTALTANSSLPAALANSSLPAALANITKSAGVLGVSTASTMSRSVAFHSRAHSRSSMQRTWACC